MTKSNSEVDAGDTVQYSGAPGRPALRYFGGKWLLAPWIIQHFPEHEAYVEPFGGAGSVLLRKERVGTEVYNDLDGQIVNFFRCVRDCLDELMFALQWTPYSIEEFRSSVQYFQERTDPIPGWPALPHVEAARRLCVLAGQGRHGASTGSRTGGGWRRRTNGLRSSSAREWGNIEHLWAIGERFKDVYIEHGPATSVLKQYDGANTLFYVDPPYVLSTRTGQDRMYRMDMTADEHRELAALLHSRKGMVVLSGYPSPLYDELYTAHGWLPVTCQARSDNGGHVTKQGALFKTECLWLSPHTVSRQRQISFLNLQEIEEPTLAS